MKHIIAISILCLSGISICAAQGKFASMSSNTPSVAASNFSNSSASAVRESSAAAPAQHVNVVNAPAPVSYSKPVSNTTVPGEHSYRGIPANPTTGITLLPVPPGVMIERYNPVTKHTLPYYSTGDTKYKSICRVTPVVRHKHHERACAPAVYAAQYFISYTCGYAYDFLAENDVPSIMDKQSSGNSIFSGSFDGYVVYGNDTLSGIVTPTKNLIVLEEPLGDMRELAGVYDYDDKKLKMVAIFEGDRELYLSRAVPGGKLMRTIHAGKLNIYDDHYSFLTTDNVNKAKLTLVYNGTVTTSKTFLAGANKQLLTNYVNKAYSLNLNAGNFTWSKLLLYIDKLD